MILCFPFDIYQIYESAYVQEMEGLHGQIADGVEQILLENHQLEMALTRKHAELAAAESGHVKTCNAILDRIAAEAIDS